VRRWRAISPRASQNGLSRLTLVLRPATVIERLTIGDLFMTTLPRNRFVTTTKELTVSLKLSREKFRLWQKSHN
jgi:hypothetical protein